MKIVLLNSGGLDSLAVAILLKNQGHEVCSLFLQLGYLNDISAGIAAQKIASMYCNSHKVISINGLDTNGIIACDSRIKPIAYNPQVCHVIAMSYANMVKADGIASGNKAETTSEDFDVIFQSFMDTALKQPKRIPVRPLKDIKNFEQIHMIIKDSPLVTETVSCLYQTPCGVCSKCMIRKRYGIDL